MTVPFRKDEADAPEMTTADLATASSTSEASRMKEESNVGRLKPVRSERSASDFLPSSHRDTTGSTEATALFPEDQLHDFEVRWNDIQTYFVDEPRSAVQKADSLVASTMKQLAEAFSRERSNLEQQWDRGDNISTEDLRVAFQRYRSFFRRLLSL
jgi:hypothetical protein